VSRQGLDCREILEPTSELEVCEAQQIVISSSHYAPWGTLRLGRRLFTFVTRSVVTPKSAALAEACRVLSTVRRSHPDRPRGSDAREDAAGANQISRRASLGPGQQPPEWIRLGEVAGRNRLAACLRAPPCQRQRCSLSRAVEGHVPSGRGVRRLCGACACPQDRQV
jgi:hypothetical protein